MKLKRQLYLWHRWLGIVMCLFMALWFISGMVMLYVGYPKLSQNERLAHLPTLPAQCCAQLPDSWAQRPLKSLRLTSLGGKPYYQLTLPDGQHISLNANTAEPLSSVGVSEALASAWQYSGEVSLIYHRLVDEDMWTHSRALDNDRPLYRIESYDAENTWLYISSRTGEVVLDVTAQERAWNWLGAWLHWLYPLRGGFGFDNGWRVAVISLALIGSVMALLGMVIGFQRVRWRIPYRNGSRSPYTTGTWLRWHHTGGLAFGCMLVLWAFSGLLSMRPWGITDSRPTINLAALQSATVRADHAPISASQAMQILAKEGFKPVELEWRTLNGNTYLLARNAQGQSRILQDASTAKHNFTREQLLEAAYAVAPGLKVQDEWQKHYDFYYFARAEQSMNGAQVRPLPVLHLQIEDDAKTWLYLDPASGALVASSSQSQRLNRWLFNLLHSWDIQALLQRPRLRESLIILFSLGGLVIATSGLVLSWRRLHLTGGRLLKPRTSLKVPGSQ